MVDPTQEVEYLNYQTQVHHDVTDGGHDQDHIPEQQHIPDEDDIEAAAAPTVLPLEPPFSGGWKIYLCCTLIPRMWHCHFGIIQIT